MSALSGPETQAWQLGLPGRQRQAHSPSPAPGMMCWYPVSARAPGRAGEVVPVPRLRAWLRST